METADIHDISRHLEVSFPVMPTTAPKRSPTKINIIVSNIPLLDARIINLVLLTTGVSLNFLIILVIVCKPSMRTATNLYVISLIISNMVILIEPLEEVLRWFFDVKFRLNMDYVCLISFDVSIITISILKFILYICIFQKQISFGHTVLRKFTTTKAIVLIWASCTISVAIGLHIYDFFEGDMADIYVWITFMFIAMPLIICISLDILIIYELAILKEIEGSWRMKELRHYVMLVVVIIAFFLVRTPYRLARAINFIEPKAVCCTETKREVLYIMAKTWPTVFAVIYILLSNEFHEIWQDILRYQFRKSSKETDVSA